MAIYTTPQTNDGFAEYTAADIFAEIPATAGILGALTNLGTVTITGSTFSDNEMTGFITKGPATIVGATFSGNTSFTDKVGGGINSTGSLVGLTSTIIDNNFGTTGSGFRVNGNGSATIVGSTFSNNRGSSALRVSVGCNVVASNTLFDGNTTTMSVSTLQHGAACLNEGRASFISSTFTNNHGQFGIIHANGMVNVYDCDFLGNTCTNGGGVLYVQSSGNYASTQSRYIGNSVSSSGGGAWFVTSGPSTSTNDLFLQNFSTGSSGGAICNRNKTIVNGSTFTANSASGSGGAVNNQAWMSIKDAKFYDNHTSASYGGAIYTEVKGAATTGYAASTTSITDSVFANNLNSHTSGYGGAVASLGSSVSITGSTFTANTCAVYGGALANITALKAVNSVNTLYASTMEVTNSTFTRNFAANSGGVARNICILTMGTCTFDGNTAAVNGGAINTNVNGQSTVGYTASTTSLDKAVFKANVAAATNSEGGAVSNHGSLFIISGSTFSANTSGKYGGAISNLNLTNKVNGTNTVYRGILEVTGSTFTGNFAAYNGGAIRNDSTISFSTCIFANNLASTAGGAINNSGHGTFTDCIFTANTASHNGSAINNSGTIYLNGSTFTQNVGDGVIYAGTAHIKDTLFTDNSGNVSTGYASALRAVSGTVSSSTFTNNLGRFGGVTYVNTNNTITLNNNTISGNRSVNVGGVAYIQSNASVISSNNIYTNNKGVGEGGGVFFNGSGSLTSTHDYFGYNTSPTGGAIQNRVQAGGISIVYGTFTANTSTGNGGAINDTNINTVITDTSFTGNVAASGGGAIANSYNKRNETTLFIGTMSVSGCTFTANTAANGGAIINHGTITIDSCVFDGNVCSTSGYGGAVFNQQFSESLNGATTVFHGLATIKDSQFLTASDYVQTASGNTITLQGTITTAATFKGGGTFVADGVNLVFNGDTAISINALTETGDGLTGVTFANTGKVTLTNQNLSAKAITINQATAGSYTLAGGISALNTNLTVNGTAMTLVNGTASGASADGQVAQVVSFASNTLSLTVYDKLFVGGNFTEDATHFASLANLQATYAGYSGLVIDCDNVFYNNTWTSETVPSTTTLGDGTVVNLAWGGNAFADLAEAKAVLDADGILTFEGIVPTTAQTEDVNTVRIHSASISAESTTIKSNRLILDSVAIPGTKRFYTDGSGDDDFVTLVNINEPTSLFYTGYIRKEGDFNLDVSNSNISRFYVSNSTNSGVGGTVNFTITDSTTNRISLSSSSDTGTSFNDINIVVNNTLVHTTKPNGETDLEQGDIRATGSSDNVHIYGDSRVTMNGSTANILFGSKGNIVHGSIYLTMDASTVANVIGKGTVDSVQGSSYLTIAGTTAASVISAAITTVDVIAVADGATLNLGDVTVTNSNFTVNTDYDGTVAVLANSTVTLAGNVSLAKNFTLGTNSALVAADDAVITLAASGTFSTTIGTGTGNTLVLDNATALTVVTAVTGFAAITFKGDTAVDLNSQSLAGKAITIDTNNVWTNGVTTIATGISSLDGATFSVNGQVAELDTPMFNGSILSFANGSLTLTVTAVEVTDTNTLDDALAATAVNPGVITFAEATDGTTCTFSGATFAHDQVLQGNGATNTAIQSADASMVFANGHEISMGSLAWNGILYGGARNADTTETSLSFQDAAIGGNVFGGGRAESGSDVSMGTVSLSIADCAQATGKAVYGGGYANGGTATIDSIALTLDDVTGGNSVYGAGAVNGGGKLGAGSVATAISGGVYGAVYNGANIYTSGTGSEFTAGEMSLAIDGGTFTGAVGNGSTPRGGASSRQGASTLAISDGLFQGIVYGGAASFGGTTTNATVASTTVTISGGTFNGKVFGGNVGQTGAKADNTVLTGASNLTIDGSTANIYFNENVFGGSMGKGVVGGNVTVTFKGNGNHLHFDTDSFLSGDSEYAYGAISYVGTKTLVFDGFTNSFSANIQGPAFNTVTVKNGSQVNVRGGAVNQDFSFVSTWNFELSNAEAVMITDDPVSSGNAKNSFYGATINLTFADGAETVVAGTDWTVYKGKEATLNYWNELGSLTIGGEVATSGTLAGSDFLAWSTDEYQVYVDGNYDIRLAKLA